MAVNDKVVDIVESAVDSNGKPVGSKGDYKFSCPFCRHPEHKKKLYVNLNPDRGQYQSFQCWVCDNRGKSLFTLLKQVDAPKRLFKRLSKHVDRSYNPKKKSGGDEEQEEVSISLPEDFRPLWKPQSDIVSKHAINRLSNRGVSYGDVVKHRIGYCRSGDFKKRLVIPSYDSEGQLNYFVGRRIWSSQFPKYKNASAPRNRIVPFESTINWREAVTIVEGPFDAISVRRNAIPILGNKMPESLFCKLIKSPTNEVNVALDADMQDVAIEIAERFLGEDFNVKLIDLPKGEDPGDVGFEEMQSRIREAKYLSFQDLISKKLWT
jgi:hypothetical protein